MKKINGRTLKEWKHYCKDDSVPIKTMKYIHCLEERVKQLAIPVVSRSKPTNTKIVLDSNPKQNSTSELYKEFKIWKQNEDLTQSIEDKTLS